MDVALAQRHLATLQANIAPIEAQIAASQHVIAVLLGRFPEDLAKELAKPGALPTLPARIPPGLPVDLLRRRPDIHAAEHQLAAATARIGVATADLFPRVILSGALGAQGGPHLSSAVPITLIGAAGPRSIGPCSTSARSTRELISLIFKPTNSCPTTSKRYWRPCSKSTMRSRFTMLRRST